MQSSLGIVRSLSVALTLFLCSELPTPAQAADSVPVVAFAGASNLPLWVGQTRGFFARQGIEVPLDITPNSVEMARNLEAGRYTVALTSIDNIVAYDEGEGEAGLGLVHFAALFGVDNGMLSLVAAPEIKSVAEVRGKPLSVDAATTGYAFVLREMLARNGMDTVELVKVGGGAQRLQGLIDKQQSVTLLNTPLDLMAEAQGFNILLRERDVLGPYQGIVAAVKQDRIDPERARLVAFARGFRDSIVWLTDPANRADAVALLVSRTKGMSPAEATAAYTALLDPANGIYRDLRIDEAGVRTVLALRSKYAMPHRELTDPSRYIDQTIRRAALESR